MMLHSLGYHLGGVPSEPCTLTPHEFRSAVMGLRVRGLVGADVRPVRDDYRIEAAPYIVDRVWLTCVGRAYLGMAAA
jgi:hypothetical protein